MTARVRAVALLSLCAAALPLLAQPAATAAPPSAADLRADVETLGWIGSIGLSPAEAKTWLAALDGLPALLANIDAQENAPEVIAALQALRAKALKGEPLTDQDWQAVDEARCRVVAARALDEPEVRRQQAILPLTAKLTIDLSPAQQLALADENVLEMANHYLALIAAGQREANDEWREHLKDSLNWTAQRYEGKGEAVAKKVGELVEAGRAITAEQWPKERMGLRDELITALGVLHNPAELPREAAEGLAEAFIKRSRLAAMLRLWADTPR